MLVGADADDILHREHEDLAVADLTGLRGRGDRADGLADEVVGQGQLDLNLGQEVDGVFAATVNLGVTFLAAEAFDFGDRHALDADFGEPDLNFVELEGFDDGDDEFHGNGGLEWVQDLAS